MRNKIIELIGGISEKSYYHWRRVSHPKLIQLLEKYFTEDDLTEFIETGKIERLEAKNRKDIEYDDFILHIAVSKIINAFEGRKTTVGDRYILEIIAFAIKNNHSSIHDDISETILKHLGGSSTEIKKLKATFFLMSKTEKKILLENKEVAAEKIEAYLKYV